MPEIAFARKQIPGYNGRNFLVRSSQTLEQTLRTACLQMTANIALADNFFQAWNRRALNTILECLTEDCLYHNIPMPLVKGRSSIEAYIAPIIARCSAIEWIVKTIAEDEQGRVLSERLDRLKINGVWLEIPLMGVLEFRGSKISAWRDYFDLQDYQRQKDRLAAT